MNHIKEHPLIGTVSIEAIRCSAEIQPVVLYDYEKFDGSHLCPECTQLFRDEHQPIPAQDLIVFP